MDAELKRELRDIVKQEVQDVEIRLSKRIESIDRKVDRLDERMTIMGNTIAQNKIELLDVLRSRNLVG